MELEAHRKLTEMLNVYESNIQGCYESICMCFQVRCVVRWTHKFDFLETSSSSPEFLNSDTHRVKVSIISIWCLFCECAVLSPQ